MDFEFYHYLLFFSVSIVSGFIDSIAGGGGLITVPVLMAANIPPHIALATNKLQASFGSFTAALNFILKGTVKIEEVKIGIIFTFIGASLGTILIIFIDAKILEHFVPYLLGFVFIYSVLNPKIGESNRQARIKINTFYVLFGLLIGFWDGFFGPGTGTFWTISIMFFLGLNLKSAVAQTKVFNFTSNIVSLSVFIFGVQILWIVGIIMGIGQMIGAYIGSNLVIKKEVKFIKAIFLSLVALVILKLFYDLYI